MVRWGGKINDHRNMNWIFFCISFSNSIHFSRHNFVEFNLAQFALLSLRTLTNTNCFFCFNVFLRDALFGSDCGGDLTDSNAIIESPGFSSNMSYNASQQCIWTISGRNNGAWSGYNSSIVVRFTELDLEAHSGCIYDFVELREGISCGKSIDVEINGGICAAPSAPSKYLYLRRYINCLHYNGSTRLHGARTKTRHEKRDKYPSMQLMLGLQRVVKWKEERKKVVFWSAKCSTESPKKNEKLNIFERWVLKMTCLTRCLNSCNNSTIEDDWILFYSIMDHRPPIESIHAHMSSLQDQYRPAITPGCLPPVRWYCPAHFRTDKLSAIAHSVDNTFCQILRERVMLHEEMVWW